MEKAMHKRIISAAVVFALLGPISTGAQESVQGSPDEQFIRQSVEDYCTAFNNGDVDTVMGYWATGSDYVDEEGETHRGKDAIAALFIASAENLKGHKLGLKIDSLRL